MFNKKFLIVFSLFLSILLVVSSVSAEEITNDNEDNIEIDGLVDTQLSINEDYLDDADSESSVLGEVKCDEEISSCDLNNDISEDFTDDSKSEDKLSETVTSDLGNQVIISDVTVYENKELIVKINTNYVDGYDTSYLVEITDSDGVIIDEREGSIESGNHTTEINLGSYDIGNYKLIFTDDYGLTCFSNIKVLRMNAKITVSNYSSYYKSGKTINIKTIDKFNNKPLSMKVKLVFKKTGATAKTYYVTTNSSGVAKFKVNLAWGTYKLTVSSANSKISSNKPSVSVKISKMPIKITVPNYSSYYKSGKKLSIKVINKKTNKGVSVKLNFIYKKPKAKSKVYYVTTNSKGIAKIKIPVGIGKYKLTVKPSSSSFKTNKVTKKVNVNKYVIFKAGKYRGKLTYKQVLRLKKAKANGEDWDYTVFTGKYYKYKEPIYKNIKVKRSRWDYKYRLAYEDWWGDWGSEWENYDPKTPKGYTWCGSVYKSGDGWSKTYYKYKKKVYYWDTKEVKTGKYKKAKDKIYMTVSTNSGNGLYPKGDLIEVWCSEYWMKYAENFITKKTKI